VRLDHLLSKESMFLHCAGTTPSWSLARSSPGKVVGRRLFPPDDGACSRRTVLSSVLREWPQAIISSRLRRHGHSVAAPASSCPGWAHGPLELLENYIASTSIFVLPSYKEPTVDALASDTDEGRGWLRKATGSCRPSIDPWISEWGNPAPVMGCHSGVNT
jgi:hypothetical protein